MDEIRYIHAADAHLDTPFSGLVEKGEYGKNLARLLHRATFRALDKLVLLCESEKPDFLVIAGDIYNQELVSTKAQLELRDACARLNAAGIRVFIAHGNHDPLTSRFASIKWPENVTIFGPQVESHVIEKNGRPVAVIHGISHERPREERNLARLFRRDPAYDCFQLGVLHCTVGNSQVADRYAPCTLEDLRQTGLDAWALGHVHERRVLSESPFIAYPGNTQGLHINEQGAKGCLLVKATSSSGVWQCEASFRQLGAIRWEKLAINLDNVEHLDSLGEKLNNDLEELRQKAGSDDAAIIARLCLEGATPLDGLLRQEDELARIQDDLGHFALAIPAIWIKDIKTATRPATEPEDYLHRDDLLGETARVAGALLENPEELREFASHCFEKLIKSPRFGNVIGQFDHGELVELLLEARRICQDALENR